ncbi:MAG: GNAT family N-acetyltransferase [Trueperella sp.]|nr:GNAT family N-acetyltransferase [Trueperella sp.]
MSELFRRARADELDSVIDFYTVVIDSLAGKAHHPAWSLEKYPTVADLRSFIAAGATYIFERDGEIAGVVNLDSNFPPDYARVPWGIDVDSSAALGVHTFAVSPHLQGRGIGHRFIAAIIDHARKAGYQAVRLDVYPINQPARHFYKSCGFDYRGQHRIAYPDVTENFYLYEYLL